MIMYPEANIPVLQMSVPTHDPVKLYELGQRLKPLRDEGVLVIGSGFLTHGLPYTDMSRGANQAAPGWSLEFDMWANEHLVNGDINSLMNYRTAPAFKYAHPTADHLVPMYVTLGMSDDPNASIQSTIDGYWYGLSKRSFAVA
jgi:4,5-DOPA dioxygenase extradiol